MKKWIEFFVRQSLFGDLITIAVIVVGIVTIFLIRREAFPNVSFDIVTIETLFPGASPDDTEKLVTSPIEQDLKEVDGIKKLQSISVENISRIVAILDPDQTSEAKGKSDIKDVVDRFNDLPKGAETPRVTSIESKSTPMIEVALSGEVDPIVLRENAKFLENEIEKIPGVARVVHRGLRDLEIRVEPNIKRLSQMRLSLDEIVQALARQNISLPGGIIDADPATPDSMERFVRTTGEFSTVEDVKATVIRANDLGQPIRVGDVADVRYELARAKILNRTNGKPSLTLTILKKESADAITLVDTLMEKIPALKGQLAQGLEVSFVNDISQYVRRRLSILTGNLLVGLSLVVFFLPLLIPLRFSILISLGVPFAFFGSMILLYNWNVSINLLSMLGLIIVVGILVDDSIVVTENSVRKMEEGLDPKTAAIEGTSQMVAPVMASVLTTAMAFLPMAFMSGIFGKFVQLIPIAVLTCLLVSVLEAFFVLPGHVATWIKPSKTSGNSRDGKKTGLRLLFASTRGFWDGQVVPVYLRMLRWSVHHRYLMMIGLFILFIGSLGLAVKGMRFVLFPPEGVEVFFIRTEAPLGTSLDRHAELVRPLERAIEGLPKGEVENFSTTVGLIQQDPNDPNSKRGSEYSQIVVYLTPENKRERIASDIIEGLRANVGKPEGLNHISFERVRPGPPTGKPVSLGVGGENYDDILAAVKELKQILGQMDGVSDIADTYTMGKEELRIQVKPKEAAAASLSVAQVASSVRAVYEGLEATKIRRLNDEVTVRVSLPAKERTSAESLEKILIPNPQGQLIPLSAIAEVSSTRGVTMHLHESNERQVLVTAEIDVSKTTSLEVNGRIRQMLGGLQAKFPKVRIGFGGEDEDTQESLRSLARAFGLAILGILLILVMTFKSLLQPFVVLLTVPLGIIAVIWAFFIHGLPLSFMGMLGMVALAGVIVNNAIVFVDFVNQRRNGGSDRTESIFEAAKDRIRPIFLTTVTTVVGILPTAYGVGGLDKFVVPIAMALGWGIAFGSLLTAFIFPAALAVLDDVQGFLRDKFGFTRV